MYLTMANTLMLTVTPSCVTYTKIVSNESLSLFSCAVPSKMSTTSTWWWSTCQEVTWSTSPAPTTCQRNGPSSTQLRWWWPWMPFTPWASSIGTSSRTTCCWTDSDTSSWPTSARAWRWTLWVVSRHWNFSAAACRVSDRFLLPPVSFSERRVCFFCVNA